MSGSNSRLKLSNYTKQFFSNVFHSAVLLSLFLCNYFQFIIVIHFVFLLYVYNNLIILFVGLYIFKELLNSKEIFFRTSLVEKSISHNYTLCWILLFLQTQLLLKNLSIYFITSKIHIFIFS